MSTFHTYPDLIGAPGRLALTEWDSCGESEAIAATIKLEPDAVVLRCGDFLGLAPGGLNA